MLSSGWLASYVGQSEVSASTTTVSNQLFLRLKAPGLGPGPFAGVSGYRRFRILTTFSLFCGCFCSNSSPKKSSNYKVRIQPSQKPVRWRKLRGRGSCAVRTTQIRFPLRCPLYKDKKYFWEMIHFFFVLSYCTHSTLFLYLRQRVLSYDMGSVPTKKTQQKIWTFFSSSNIIRKF